MFIQRQKDAESTTYTGTFELKAGYLGAAAESVATITDGAGKLVGSCALGGSIVVPQGDHYTVTVKTGGVDRSEALAVGVSVLAIGQSNMQFWSGGGSARPMEDGTYELGATGKSLAVSVFTDTLKSLLGGVPIGFVQSAVAGSGLLASPPASGQPPKDYWTSFAKGGLYESALDDLKRASGGRAEVVLWNQGETDIRNDKSYAEYKAGLGALMDRLKSDIGPFDSVLMGIGDNRISRADRAEWAAVDQAKKDWAAEQRAAGAKSSYMDTPALMPTREDDVHYDKVVYSWIAYGAAREAAALILGQPASSLPDLRTAGAAGDDVLSAQPGAEAYLFGAGGADQLRGGDGDDILIGGDGDDTILGGLGNDGLSGDAGDDVLAGMAGDDDLYGGAGSDVLSGGAGADALDGGSGDDTLDGGAGNDTLIGGSGADSLSGGDGDDRFFNADGRETIDGGDGVDTLDLNASGDAWILDLTVVRQAGGLTLRGVENVSGGRRADVVSGTDEVNILAGMDGDDVLFGRGGDDRLSGGRGSDTLDGGAGDDVIDGGGGLDVLLGGDGNDLLVGEMGGDRYDGGAGVDMLDLHVALRSASVDLRAELQADGSRIAGVENVSGTNADDRLVGSNGANLLKGGSGDDTLEGGAGADTLTGGLGADVFAFKDRSGNDVVTDFAMTGDQHDVLQFDRSQVADWQTLLSHARQVGTSVQISLPTGDVITLQNARLANFTPDDVRFQGGRGMFIQRDKLADGSGYAGTFTLKAGYLGARPGLSTATITDANGRTVGSCEVGGSIQVPQGDHYEIAVRTGGSVQTEPLAVGVSVLAIGQSNMYGWVYGPSARAMEDGTYLLNSGGPHAGSTAFTAFLRERLGDVPIGYTSGAVGGTPLLDPQNGKDYWSSFAKGGLYDDAMGALKATTKGRAEIVLWNQGEADTTFDRTYAEYKQGLDALMTRLGADIGAFQTLIMGTPPNNLYAGPGQKHYKSGLEVEQAKKDWVKEHSDEAAFMATPGYLGHRDGLHFNGAGYAWMAYGAAIETAAMLLDKPASEMLDERKLGTDAGDAVTTQAGQRSLYFGGLGADSIEGGALDDVLIGGAGNDVVTGMGGDDALEGETGEDTLSGMDGDDDLWGGADGDRLLGGAGDDMLDGGKGDDTMEGGAGDDLFLVDSLQDVVIENAGEGIDEIYSQFTYALPAHVENLTLGLAANADGTGNALANLMTGNMGANRLSGEAGDDTLIGASGADTLVGGAGRDLLEGGVGADVFVFQAGFGADVIKDFDQVGDDMLEFSTAAFADWTAVWAATRQVGADLAIARSATDVITLKNVALSSFTADDVRFVS